MARWIDDNWLRLAPNGQGREKPIMMRKMMAALVAAGLCSGARAMSITESYNNTMQQQAELERTRAQTQALQMWSRCVQAAGVDRCGPPPQIQGKTTDFACVERQLKVPYYGQDSEIQRLATALNSCSR